MLFAFAAVVIGGLGSLWGTLLGGVVLGVAQQIGAQINISYEVLAGYLVFLAVLVTPTSGPDLAEGSIMTVATEPTARSAEKIRVTRSRRNMAWTGGGALVVVVVLALFPYIVYSGTTGIMVQGFVILTLASMWNLLAGYAGLVSVGQQAFVGLGAYFVLILAINGISPFAALPVAAIGCGVAALPMWWLVSRLRTGYFAIATWVLAATVMLIIERFSSLGGGTGLPMPGLSGIDPTLLTAYTYWIGLAVTVLVAGHRLAACCAAGWGSRSPPSGTTRSRRRARACGSGWSGCSSSWWPGSAAARPARSTRSACSACSRTRCSACSGRPRWRSR